MLFAKSPLGPCRVLGSIRITHSVYLGVHSVAGKSNLRCQKVPVLRRILDSWTGILSQEISTTGHRGRSAMVVARTAPASWCKFWIYHLL